MTEFDHQSYLVATYKGKNSRKSKLENELLKQQALSTIYSSVTILLNKGKDEADIYSAVKDMPQFLAFCGKRPEKYLRQIITNINVWNYHSNAIMVWHHLLGHVHEGSQSKRIQKETRALQPLILTLVALQQSKDVNRMGYMSLVFISRIVGVIHALSTVDDRTLTRKLKSYEKQQYIRYAPGVKGGIATRLGLEPYTGTLTVEQKQAAAELILSKFDPTSMCYALLAQVLNYVAALEGTPIYNDCDLSNKVDFLAAYYRRAAKQVGEERKAERLIESADFEQALTDEAEEVTQRVTAMLKAGVSLFGKAAVEAPESHVDELEEDTLDVLALDLNAALEAIWEEEHARGLI